MSRDETGADDLDWHGLGQFLVRRRGELGLTQQGVADAGGPSHATVRKLENGQATRYLPDRIAKLEDALQVGRGSVARVLRGKEPLPYTAPVDASGHIATTLRALIAAHGVDAFATAIGRVVADAGDPADRTPVEVVLRALHQAHGAAAFGAALADLLDGEGRRADGEGREVTARRRA